MLADYHIHTAFSNDSEYPMEQVVLDAMDLGLTEICITDHVDYGIKRDHDDPRGICYCPGGPGEPEMMSMTNIEYPRYAAEITRLQQRYGDRISIKMGAEFGVQTHTIPQYQSLFSRYPFDFIILSVHQVGDQEFWTQEYQQGRSQREYNMGYYEELLALTQQYQTYSVLGHLDLIARYDLAGHFPFSERKAVLTEILKNVIRNGKGIEVNTSCYRYGLSDLTPACQILELYRDLGGRILTIGSDSHRKGHLGSHIAQTQQKLKTMGFRELCTYTQMEPVFHRLP